LAALVAGDRLFQARAAATGNARSPMLDRRVDGTCSAHKTYDKVKKLEVFIVVHGTDAKALQLAYVGPVPT